MINVRGKGKVAVEMAAGFLCPGCGRPAGQVSSPGAAPNYEPPVVPGHRVLWICGSGCRWAIDLEEQVYWLGWQETWSGSVQLARGLDCGQGHFAMCYAGDVGSEFVKVVCRRLDYGLAIDLNGKTSNRLQGTGSECGAEYGLAVSKANSEWLKHARIDWADKHAQS